LYINPAYAGYRGPLNLHTYYRSQWTGMPDGPRTLALAADMRTASDNVGLGFNLMSDRVGLEKRIYAYANYAYRLRVGWDPEDRLAFGIGIGVIHSAFDNAGWNPRMRNRSTSKIRSYPMPASASITQTIPFLPVLA